jgi:protein-tyrosine phosphatase
MAVRTSESDPIKVGFLPADAGLGPIPIGMTFAPGKKAPGIAGIWERDLDADLERLATKFRARVLVSLLEEHEYADLGITDLPTAAQKHGLEFLSLPIQDGGIPPSLSDAMAFVPQILDRLRTKGTVVVHCRGGLGRTGLIVACCLTTVGDEPPQAIAKVRDARPGAIENARQEAFIAEFAAEWKRHPR